LLRFAAAAAPLLLLLLLVGPARAQGQLIIVDPGGRLDRGAIEDAAAPLLDQGAEIGIYLVQSGGDADFLDRLVDDGLARSDGLARTKLIAIYAALDQRYSAIRYGDDWAYALGVNDNYDAIRQAEFNPGLSSGDFTQGYVDALAAIETAAANPPTAGGGTEVNVDLRPIAAVGGGLAVVAAGGVALSRRNAARRRRAAVEQKLKEAREGAGVLIAALGQRFRTAEEKAQFDKVSYAPEDVQRVSALQAAARQSFAKVQNAFDDVGEGLDRYGDKATDEQLGQATAGYDQVTQEARAVEAQIGAVEQLRLQLDEQAAQARGEVDRAKKS
jgi:hypothetical protein